MRELKKIGRVLFKVEVDARDKVLYIVHLTSGDIYIPTNRYHQNRVGCVSIDYFAYQLKIGKYQLALYTEKDISYESLMNFPVKYSRKLNELR